MRRWLTRFCKKNANYKRIVRPRAQRILREYARETSLQDLKRLLQKIDVWEFLKWKGPQKCKTFRDVLNLLLKEGVNTEDDLRTWLQWDDSKAKLLEIDFIGPKTVDYLKVLVGLDEAAMDLHLFRFLEGAGLGKLSYERAKEVIHQTADSMGWKRADLDHSIWRYMSGGKLTPKAGSETP